MTIKLPIINEPDAGLCTAADLTSSGKTSKLLISTSCRNNYVSEKLYAQLEHKNPQPPVQVKVDTAYYLNLDRSNARTGIIKALSLPGHTLIDIPVIVTQSYPAYRCDMVLGLPITSAYRLIVDHANVFVIISDEKLGG